MIYGSKTDKNPSNFDTMILVVTLISYLSASFFVCFFLDLGEGGVISSHCQPRLTIRS